MWHRLGRLLPAFWGNLSFPSSRANQSEDICLCAIQIIFDIHSALCFLNFLTNLVFCIVSVLLHIYVISSYECIFLSGNCQLVDVQFVHIINVIKSTLVIHHNFGQSVLAGILNTACPRALGLTSVNGVVYKLVMILSGVY